MPNDSRSTSPFSVRLRETRISRKLDQAALGELANIPATSISHFESESGNANRASTIFEKLADALQVSIDYLLGRTDNPSAHLDAAAYRHEDQMVGDQLEEMEELMERIRTTLATRTKSKPK